MFFCIDGAFILALAGALALSKSVRALDLAPVGQSTKEPSL